MLTPARSNSPPRSSDRDWVRVSFNGKGRVNVMRIGMVARNVGLSVEVGESLEMQA
jgi:hypothetical protein